MRTEHQLRQQLEAFQQQKERIKEIILAECTDPELIVLSTVQVELITRLKRIQDYIGVLEWVLDSSGTAPSYQVWGANGRSREVV